MTSAKSATDTSCISQKTVCMCDSPSLEILLYVVIDGVLLVSFFLAFACMLELPAPNMHAKPHYKEKQDYPVNPNIKSNANIQAEVRVLLRGVLFTCCEWRGAPFPLACVACMLTFTASSFFGHCMHVWMKEVAAVQTPGQSPLAVFAKLHSDVRPRRLLVSIRATTRRQDAAKKNRNDLSQIGYGGGLSPTRIVSIQTTAHRAPCLNCKFWPQPG